MSNFSETNPLWGARFSEGAGAILEEINSSVHFDSRLAQQDIAGSVAHAKMLQVAGILNERELEEILVGLADIGGEILRNEFTFDAKLEDVHMNIEQALFERIGASARKLHTGRSRNDQVAVDMKLWVRDQMDVLNIEIKRLIETIGELAELYYDFPMPGFTHLQAAQPITLGHHLLAYGEMFMRDRGRLADARRRLNESPLGAAALAGTAHPIDREMTAQLLGFDGPAKNSIDAVSDRDFLLEFLSAASMLAIHMSRLGEEVVLWCSQQFGYATLADHLSAGSSIMPQKKNPDAAELVRAKSGRVIGNLVSLLMVMKGLPLAYSRDMQEDKEPVFDGAYTVNLCVRTTNAILRGLKFHGNKMYADAKVGNTLATDIADWLVANRGLAFRDAHFRVGHLVKTLEEMGLELRAASIEILSEISPEFSGLPSDFLTIERSINSRSSYGGTAPVRVREAAIDLLSRNVKF